MGMKYTNIGGIVFAFKRPDYLRQTLKSIESNKEAHDIPWYAFLDGAVNEFTNYRYGKDEDIQASYDILEASPLNFNITRNETNECIARQKHKAHRLYDKHDCLYFFEDDMVISPYYLRLLRIALEQFPMYSVLLHTGKQNGMLNKLTNCGVARIWGYGMSRRLYRKIKPGWDKYHASISKVDYLIRTRIPNLKETTGIRWHSHDINITKLCREKGKGKLWPQISRGLYIGRKGSIAFRTDYTWKKRKMDRQAKKIVYPSDANFKAWVKA